MTRADWPSEGILIEIATRFRKLEDAIQSADSHLFARQMYHDAEYKQATDSTRPTLTKEEAMHEVHRDAIADIRMDLENCADACRDDLVLLSEICRKGAENV